MGDLQVVHRVEEGMDRRGILCTTYQMRNPFKQFRDAVATELDAFCYFQHQFVAQRLCIDGARVLDVCCGRGLLIPFLRYGSRTPSLYVGVDIAPRNAPWSTGEDPRTGSQVPPEHWQFPVRFVEANVADMATAVEAAVAGTGGFHLVAFTSSIEHMQPAAQRQALHECAALALPGATLYLTSPVTEEGGDGYDCQYAAHVYEPTREELWGWLEEAGWQVRTRMGLLTKAKVFRRNLDGGQLAMAERIYAEMPRAQALTTIAHLWPVAATEMGWVCTWDGL